MNILNHWMIYFKREKCMVCELFLCKTVEKRDTHGRQNWQDELLAWKRSVQPVISLLSLCFCSVPLPLCGWAFSVHKEKSGIWGLTLHCIRPPCSYNRNPCNNPALSTPGWRLVAPARPPLSRAVWDEQCPPAEAVGVYFQSFPTEPTYNEHLPWATYSVNSSHSPNPI